MDEDQRRENLRAILEKAARASLGDHSWNIWKCPCGQKNRVDRVRVMMRGEVARCGKCKREMPG